MPAGSDNFTGVQTEESFSPSRVVIGGPACQRDRGLVANAGGVDPVDWDDVAGAVAEQGVRKIVWIHEQSVVATYEDITANKASLLCR